MRLVHDATQVEVAIGDEITDFRGEKAIVTGWDKPHKPASTGRVYVRAVDGEHSAGFYPSVFDLTWIEREDRA